MTPMRRAGLPERASVPVKSTTLALPSGRSSESAAASAAGARPSWPRQRLTLGRRPPPSPARELIFTEAAAPLSPAMAYLAIRNWVSGASDQPVGTVQVGLAVAASIGGSGWFISGMGGWD